MISGNYGGCRLESLAKTSTRPTTDKIKEPISSIVGPCLDGETVLDPFVGNEGLAVEAVSRDCSHAVCAGKSYQALKIIKENIEIMKEPEKFTTIKFDADKTIERLATEEQQLDYLFLDLPYAKQKTINQIHKVEELEFFSKTAAIVYETDRIVELPGSVAGFRQIRRQIYGITVVTIYRREGKR